MKHSQEIRDLISEKRKRYLMENPDKHPWKRKDKKISIPCENFKKFLGEKEIEYIEEYSPLEDRFFSIDIAFPHIKIGIEINGNQHYNSDGSLKKYYRERHDLIEKEGWKIIEVHYSQCFNKESMGRIIDFQIPYDDSGIIKNLLLERERKIELNKVLPRGQKAKLKSEEKWNLTKNDIFNHDIDFKKFGWVNKVSEIIGIKPQKISGWMKRYHPDFYEKECFKRKPV